MGYVINSSGAGDANATNQLAQIDQITNNTTTVSSVFKDPISGSSLFYKSIRNNNLSGTPMICVSFTAATAAAVSTLLNTFLGANDIYIVSLTSTQSVGSHDLFLLYANA